MNRAEELLIVARSMIRDMAHGYPAGELVESPESVCKRISDELGEEYDFDKGEVNWNEEK